MEGYVLEWLNLLGRWVHLVTGIAWIGASFYFVWLDNHLQAPKSATDVDRGVGGEIWSVHGGGFYHAQKYTVAPPSLPETLHWFKWEAYTTWITGAFMLALMYWYQAEIYLIDPNIMALSKTVAVIVGVLTLVVGWLAYDQLCKLTLEKSENLLAAIMLVLLTIVAWALCQVFSGRGAFMHFGAMLGTIMVANVYFVIMPGQRDLVRAKEEGRVPEAIHGIRAKQRSVHNTYFTLPVLFVMISNHYATTFGHEYNWLILIGLSIAGALIRVYFVQRHKGRASLLPIAVAAVLIMGIAAAITPSHSINARPSSTASAAELFTSVHDVVQLRCSGCHLAEPTYPGFSSPPKGIIFETRDDTAAQALVIHQQAVVTKAMPIGNLTAITDEERALIDSWFRSGAKME